MIARTDVREIAYLRTQLVKRTFDINHAHSFFKALDVLANFCYRKQLVDTAVSGSCVIFGDSAAYLDMTGSGFVFFSGITILAVVAKTCASDDAECGSAHNKGLN